MEPGEGRFVSVDLLRGVLDDPLTLHKYLYSNDNPINLTDPSGLAAATAPSLTQQLLFLTVLALLAAAAIPRVRVKTRRRNLPFRVRLQAQGSGLEESENFRGTRPMTVSEGLAGLEILKARLTKRERKARDQALAKAAKWISGRPPQGAGPPGKSGFTNKEVTGDVARIDVEIFAGVNFVN